MAEEETRPISRPCWRGCRFRRIGRSWSCDRRARAACHGPDENRAFANLPPFSQGVTDSLCRLVLLEILPAVLEHDLAAFGAALGELQAQGRRLFCPGSRGHLLDGPGAGDRRVIARRSALSASARAPGARLSTPFRLAHSTNSSRRSSRLRQRFGLDHTARFLDQGGQSRSAGSCADA